jgi:predicted nucleotide-binding protein (sugar kinase/HSP70/actin superfamily)
VALNKSVGLALAARAQRKIVVPAHPELMGGVGTALMARDRLLRGDLTEGDYSLDRLAQGEMETKETFRCKTCENNCEIQRIVIRGKVYPFGGLCSKYDLERHKSKGVKEGRDLIAVRNEMMFEEFGPRHLDRPRGRIGLPMALTTFDLFPFYARLINELGYEVVPSRPSRIGNTKAAAAFCYPCEIVHGAVYDLLQRNVDFIFLPRTVEMDIPDGALHCYTCPSTTVIADVIKATFEKTAGRILCPHIGLSSHLLETTMQEIGGLSGILGLEEGAVRKAGAIALSHYEKFRKAYLARSREELERLSGEPTVILAGRPYITCSPDVNLALPRKITSRGYHAIPADMLPRISGSSTPRDVWRFTQQITNTVAYVERTPNAYVCLVSCFSCGPDASMYHFIRQKMAGQTFCYLEIDSHTAHAGFETRVGAFLDIVEEKRRKENELTLISLQTGWTNHEPLDR